MGPEVPQPDLTLRILPEWGGQSTVEGKYGSGAPELIIEVSGSSARLDMGVKARLYERVGVREYVTVLYERRRVVWRVLDGGRYQEVGAGPDGVFRSTAFPGFRLAGDALWSFDTDRLQAVLEQGLASADHAEFAARLRSKRP